MILVTGFNRFNQLYSLRSVFGEHNKECVSTKASNNEIGPSPTSEYVNPICEFLAIERNLQQENLKFFLSWSYCFLYERDTIWICGFVKGKDSSVRIEKSPNNCAILQASGNRRQVLCVTDDGHCWQFNIENATWKDLTGILHTQVMDEDAEDPVAKLCCGDTITALLTVRGAVYNFPNKLILPGEKIVDIACGRGHILMLSSKGEVFSAGEGSRGQLGHGELEGEEEPRLVEGLAGLTVSAIACGGWHSCAITADGDLYSWGWNMSGQLGLKTKQSSKVAVQTVPTVVDWSEELEVQVKMVACGVRHTIAVLDDGTVWGCGWNGYGQLALSGVENVDYMTKLPIPDVKVGHILCGPWNTCLVT